MRGYENRSDALFLYVSPESFVPGGHPLRPIRLMADKALASLSGEFEKMYSHTGRPSVPPEVLLKSLLLQILFSIRSNRSLVEQLGYNILYRWFLGVSLEDVIWDHSTFSQNQERLIGTDIAGQFLQRVITQAKEAQLLSKDHFSVDGTLIDAWASMKSFQPREGGPNPPHRTKRRGGFSRATPEERHAFINDGSGFAPIPQGQRERIEALLHGTHTHGEPKRPGAGCPCDSGHRDRRARSGRRDDPEHSGDETSDCRRGQGL